MGHDIRVYPRRLFQLAMVFTSIALQSSAPAAAAVSPEPSKSILDTPVGALELISALLLFIAGGMAVKTERLKKSIVRSDEEIETLKRRLKQLQDFSNRTIHTEFVDSEIVFLGPRGHGKTSIVTCVTKQWKAILDTKPTPTDFVINTWELPTHSDEEYFDENLGIKRTRRSKPRIKIYDYAGEDQSIGAAIERIAASTGGIVVFVLSAEPEPPTSATVYFNVNTLRRMRSAFATSLHGRCTAFILFSKQDLTVHSNVSDPLDIPDELKARHAQAIENIEAVFGELPKIMVSAETGYGIATSLRSILAVVVDKDGGPQQ